VFSISKGAKLDICKALFVGKLSLAALLLFMAIKMALLPAHLKTASTPRSAVAEDSVPDSKTAGTQDFIFEGYAEIVERNPFALSGDPTAINHQASKNNSFGTDDAVSKQLGLELFGTIAGSPAVARAIIKNLKTGVLDLYKIGQTVEEARIENIETDSVILLHNGQRKILRLNILSAGNGDNILTLSSRTIDNTSQAVKINVPVGQNPPTVQSKMGYMEAVLDEAVIEPYLVNSRTEGLKITGMENIKAAKDLGLKNGDIIRTVNGHRLTSKQKAFQVFKKAKSEPSVGLELMRDGEIKTLSFSLR
jgi:type II secretion system protein C